MYDLIIIGAGPAGIALAAEACASGINQSQILVLEKGATHNSAIRQLYPDQKLTTANYKGFDALCEGLLCISDLGKSETIEFLDKVIADYRINIQFNQGSSACTSSTRTEEPVSEWNPQLAFMRVGSSRSASAYLAARINRRSIDCCRPLRRDFYST
jgi:hypothetical protein